MIVNADRSSTRPGAAGAGLGVAPPAPSSSSQHRKSSSAWVGGPVPGKVVGVPGAGGGAPVGAKSSRSTSCEPGEAAGSPPENKKSSSSDIRGLVRGEGFRLFSRSIARGAGMSSGKTGRRTNAPVDNVSTLPSARRWSGVHGDDRITQHPRYCGRRRREGGNRRNVSEGAL